VTRRLSPCDPDKWNEFQQVSTMGGYFTANFSDPFYSEFFSQITIKAREEE